MNIFMRFPGGRAKAMTLSYDDGVESDVRLIEIMHKNGLYGTFNVNFGVLAPEGKVYPAGTVHRRMSRSGIVSAYRDSGMEVAIHGFTHPYLDQLPPEIALSEVYKDRVAAEEIFGGPIRGMAYPYGTFSDTVVNILKTCGIAYCRTVRPTRDFRIPEFPLLLDPTCKHLEPALFELLGKFLDKEARHEPQLFYLWGHTFEFDRDGNWDLIERFAETAGGHGDDVWYATNIDIIDYIAAYRSLRWTLDMTRFTNPTSTKIWLTVGVDGVYKNYTAAPGETVDVTT